jgi:hypothetical protein
MNSAAETRLDSPTTTPLPPPFVGEGAFFKKAGDTRRTAPTKLNMNVLCRTDRQDAPKQKVAQAASLLYRGLPVGMGSILQSARKFSYTAH